MKLNFLTKFLFLMTIKLTTAGRACNKGEPAIMSHKKIAGTAKQCNKASPYLNHCLETLSYKHHSYFACYVCTTPSCKYGNINCGSGSSTKELHWSLDVFEVGFYTYSLSKSGFIKIVLNNKIFHNIELSYERASRKITIKLKECTNTNEGKEDCIENRSEVHENLDPKYSCIFVAIGYQNASTINFVTIHTCSRVASSYIGVKNVYSLKRPIENFVKRFMKKITIQFVYDEENIFDGVPIIMSCGPGGFFYYGEFTIPCTYVFPENTNDEGIGYYQLIYEGFSNKFEAKDVSPLTSLTPSYFKESGMMYSDLWMKLFESPDYKYDASKYRYGCDYIDRPKSTPSPKTTETIKLTTITTLTTSTPTTSTSTTSTSTTSTVTDLQTNLTSTTEVTLKPDLTTTTVEIPLPDIVIPTVSKGEFNPPVIEKVQVTLPPLPVITIGNATLIRNTSGLNKLNLTAFMKAVGTDSLHPSYLLSEMNPNNFLIPLRNNSLVDVGQYQLSSPEKVKKKKKSSSQAVETDTFSSGTKSLVIIFNKCNLLLLFLKVF